MKKSSLILLAILMNMPVAMQAQVPRLVHYQGELNNEDGTPFEGLTDLHFSIFTSISGDKPIWSEIHKNVSIANGSYEVLLGSQNPLDLSFHEYFLDIKVAGSNSSDRRVKIVGSGYNFRLSFLFAAYTIVWVAIFGYLLSISRRQKKLIAELSVLSEA